MRCLFPFVFAALVSIFPIAASGQSAGSNAIKERWTRFRHQLRQESPRWPDGRYYEKYSFRGEAGDRIIVGLAGEQSAGGTPGSHQHLSLYVDRGDGVEPVRAGPDGFEAELLFEQAGHYLFYVISRRPEQSGGYTLVFISQTANQPQPVYYHMIFDEILQAGHTFNHNLQIKENAPPIRVRVDAKGFKPILQTLRFDAGSFGQVTYPSEEKEGHTFASSLIRPFAQDKWQVVVLNRSTAPGSFRLVIEHPSPWHTE